MWALNLALGLTFPDPAMAEKGPDGMRKAGLGAPRGVRRVKAENGVIQNVRENEALETI